MPKTQKKALQEFLLNLIEKPQALKKLRTSPATFISKSALSKTHKQVLLSSDAKKIKDAVAEAVANLEFYPNIHAAADAELGFYPHMGAAAASKAQIAYIHISGDKPPKPKGLKGSQEFAFHIVFGASQPKVKVSLKPKVPKKSKISKNNPAVLEAFAIHIHSDQENA